MQSMKRRGWSEVDSALRRVRSLHALGRVGLNDKVYIEDRLQEVLSRINSMREEGQDGEEIGGSG